MLKKFQDFAMKGNAFDLAVGVIIGAAFGGSSHRWSATSSCRSSARSPAASISATTSSGCRARSRADTLAEAKKQGAVLAWGNFLTIVINFLIVAAVMFDLVNMIQRIRQQEEAKPRRAAAARSC